jgi:hypothetical protein
MQVKLQKERQSLAIELAARHAENQKLRAAMEELTVANQVGDTLANFIHYVMWSLRPAREV